MHQAEEYAIKFIEDLHLASAQNDDFLYMVYLLMADDKKEKTVVGVLRNFRRSMTRNRI